MEKPKIHYSKIDEESKKTAIWNSGYLLERRVAALLRSSGYKTVTNRGFFDPEINKSREYDVYAYKEVKVFEKGSYGIYPTLVCECKNSSQPIVFFVHRENIFAPLIDEVMVSGIPAKIWKRNKYISIQEFIDVAAFHHYCKPVAPVASQCCTFNYENKGRFWNASHGEELHDTERTLTKALENEVNDDFKNMSQWLVPAEIGKKFIDLSFYYPVVIYQGDVETIYVRNNDAPSRNDLIIKKCDHVQYNAEFYSFYYKEVISYHVDVVSESYLPVYLKLIDEEMLKIKEVLKQQKRSVLGSVDRIITEFGTHDREPVNYRKLLGYDF
jgi:hypothetical protein